MICKKCGAMVVDGQCTACGEKVKLANRSRELERLMSAPEAAIKPQDQSGRQPEPERQDSLKGYQQGLEAGYQNGLKDGYRKASEEIKKKDEPASGPGWGRPRVVLAAVLAAIVLSGVVSGLVSFGRGVRKAEGEAQIKLTAADDKLGEYEGALTEARDKLAEVETALAETRSKLAQTETGKEESYQEGFEAGREAGMKEGYQQGASEVRQQAEAEEKVPKSGNQILYEKKTKKHSQGVILIQELLNDLMNLRLTTDGDYGEATERAVRDFQGVLRINQTGSVDWVTLGGLVYYGWGHPDEFKALYAAPGAEGPESTGQPVATASPDASATLSPEDAAPEEDADAPAATPTPEAGAALDGTAMPGNTTQPQP